MPIRELTFRTLVNLGDLDDAAARELEAEIVPEVTDGIEDAIRSYRLDYTDVQATAAPCEPEPPSVAMAGAGPGKTPRTGSTGVIFMNIAAMTLDDLLVLRRSLDVNCRTGYSPGAIAEAQVVIGALSDEIRLRTPAPR